MRYSKFFIALTCLVTSSSFAFDITTPSEEKALQQIQEKYDVDSQLVSANNKLSSYNKSQYDQQSLAITIENDKAKYEQLIKALPATIIASIGVEEYFKTIEDLVVSINRAEKAVVANGIALKEQYQMIELDYAKLSDLRREKNEQLSSLKKQVVDRLVKEISQPNSAQKFNQRETAVCSQFQSINNCLAENEKIIVSKMKKSKPFLNERSALLSYKVNSASMNMDGGLNYSVSMSFKPSYTGKVEALLNEKFGLKSTVITLESNVSVDWYIDGSKIGEGKKIEHEVSLGRHGILASYGSHAQSSVEVIDGNAQFSYVFEDNIVPLLPKESSEADAQPSEDADKQTNLNRQHTETYSATTKSSRFLDFIGIDADS